MWFPVFTPVESSNLFQRIFLVPEVRAESHRFSRLLVGPPLSGDFVASLLRLLLVGF
jgi:hypothetical protein